MQKTWVVRFVEWERIIGDRCDGSVVVDETRSEWGLLELLRIVCAVLHVVAALDVPRVPRHSIRAAVPLFYRSSPDSLPQLHHSIGAGVMHVN